MYNPKVSIVIPVFNGSNYLKEAIDSALNQTYTNIEVLVINDGSQDEGQTKQIALSYGNKIRYFEKDNGGVATALNLGIDHMTGEYFSWLSHDDRYKSSKIGDQIKLLETLADKTTIIYGGYDLIDAGGTPYYQVNPRKDYSMEQLQQPLFPIFKGIINGCTLLIHRGHFKRVGGFDKRLLSTQDSDMWFRMFRGAKIVYGEAINVETRIHDARGSITMPNNEEEANKGWIKRMHQVTAVEMIALAGSVEKFYLELAHFLKGFKKYRPAYEEAARLANVFKKVPQEKDKVSVIIPFYNRIPLVIESLKSAIDQTYNNLEILLIDDGSTEEGEELMKVVQSDERIRYIKQANLGVSVARNRGIEEATGAYLAFLDADDLLLPKKIAKQLQFMHDHQYVFSHTSYQRISSGNQVIGQMNAGAMKGIVFPEIIYMCLVATPTVMVKKEALDGLRFKVDVTVSQDICLWMDLAYRYELGGLEECLTQVRIGTNTTFYNKEKAKLGFLNVLNHIFEHPDYLREDEAVKALLVKFEGLFDTKSKGWTF